MNVDVLWCSKHPEILARHYADQGLLEAVLDRSVWTPPDPITFTHHEVRGDFPDVEGALVAINCRTHASDDDTRWFRKQLRRLRWAVVLLCGDEEWVFPWQQIAEFEQRRVWVMQARPEHAELSGFLPGGWYPGTRELLAPHEDEARTRPLDWFFAGQVNHDRREDCVKVLADLDGGRLVRTRRYLEEGIPKADYFQAMASAKVIPCPSGPYSVDCARTFEALEAGCIPVADTVTARAGAFDYWELLFGDPQFPRITDWADFPEILEVTLDGWEAKANRCWSRWQQYKRQLAHRLDGDLRAVSNTPRASTAPDDQITVVVTTSPAPLHPSTAHLEQVIDSVRFQLPRAEIVVAVDGVRPEMEHRRADYDAYTRRLLWLTNFEWHNVVPVVLDEWGHQANAARAALGLVATPLVLFVEHDTPVLGDIDWSALCAVVGSGEANCVRFHENTEMHPDHETMMLDPAPRDVGGVPLRRTSAWWQRPHLAATRFYRERIMGLIAPEARTMIEEPVYAVFSNAVADHGESAWWDWRVYIYSPPGDMRRSGHLDSRGDDPKGPMLFAYNGPTPAGALPEGWHP